MSAFVILRRVVLGDHHLHPGRTRHSLNGEDFPRFLSLEIAQYPNDNGFYLLHSCASGEVAHTWHESMEEAMHQAPIIWYKISNAAYEVEKVESDSSALLLN